LSLITRARADWQNTATPLSTANQEAERVHRDTLARITKEQAPIRVKVAELEKLQRAKAQREREQRERERARAEIGKTFAAMARSREIGGFGWYDDSADWQATPPALRETIDGFLKAPKEARAEVLEHMLRDPGAADKLVDLVAQRHEKIRTRGRGR
jgi:(p)ppGpp synthase/HD superfamily hydrolase